MRMLFSILLFILLPAILSAQSNDRKNVNANFLILESTHNEIINKLSIRSIRPIVADSKVHISGPSFAHTAFFCKIEDKIEHRSKLPIRMRLGDLNYTNTIEGKNVHDLSSLNPRRVND